MPLIINAPLRQLVIIIGTFCSGVPMICRAQDDYLSMSLEQLLQTKVLSSTLTEESLKTVPSSVTVFSRQQIQQLGITSLEELMNHVPGYQSYRSDNGVANYSARSRRIANGNREVLILVDGQRLNDDALGIPTVLDLSTDNVERIEFIRGPGSAIYGANAFLGVINIITSRNQHNLNLAVGNYQQNSIHLNASREFDSGLQTSLALESKGFGSGQSRLYDPLGGAFVDGHLQQTELNSIYWRTFLGDWSLQVRHADFAVDDGYVLGNLSDNSTKRDNFSNLVSVNYAHKFSDGWELDSRAYSTPYRMEYDYRINTAPTISTLVFAGSEAGLENHLTRQLGTAKLLLGVDFTLFSLSTGASQLTTPLDVSSSLEVIDKKDRKLQALYGQWQNNITDNLSYTLGVRYDDYSDVGNHISPRVGLVYQVDSENSLKLLYGNAFRSPARNELYIKNNQAQMGNPNLHPETAQTSELVWTQTAKHYYLSFGFFNTVIANPVVLGDTEPPKLFINAAQQQHISGLEWELKASLGDDWLLSATASHIIQSALAVNPDAEDLASMDLIYTRNLWTLSFSGIYHGAVRDSDTSTIGYHALGGVTTWDAYLNYHVAQTWSIDTRLRNLTNKFYYAPALQNTANVYGVPATGREIEIGIHWDF